MTAHVQIYIPDGFWAYPHYDLLKYAKSIGNLKSVSYSEWLLDFKLETKEVKLNVVLDTHYLIVNKMESDQGFYKEIFKTPKQGCVSVFKAFWQQL